jgi:type II secretory pathway pseudopilin PulG
MTMIELLVVMMIIATLASLVLAAVFAVQEAQRKNFVESLVQKLASALDQQWKAAVDQIRDEPVPQQFLAMAWGDPLRARVLYTKARLAQEFPVTFDQARNPLLGLAPKPVYQYLPPSSAATQPLESSVLLVLAVTQGRRGLTAFTTDQIEPTARKTVSLNNPTSTDPKALAFRDYTYVIDGWGTPLRYYAFPYYNDELNAPPYYDPTNTAKLTVSPDPQDPERKLEDYNTLLAQGAQQRAGVTQFVAAVHPLLPGANHKTVLRNLIPVVASAGKDANFGDDANPGNARLWMSLTGPGASDNIYSYRLRRAGQRGG